MSQRAAPEAERAGGDAADPAMSARVAGLRYVRDDMPGVSRRRAGRGWTYRDANGARIGDTEELRRFAALAIPPAWTDVWICANPNGHIQATGRDARGRKQYVYHVRWQATRDRTKYEHTVAFGEALPAIRRRTAEDLALPGLPREKVLALVVRLLEATLIRVGNEEYARRNGSVGLTTMRDRHVSIDGSTLRFSFRGKSGMRHSVGLRDPRLARLVRRCQELPGEELFQYVEAGGERRSVSSEDVNDYLRTITGEDFTAKDFRTWAGTVLAVQALRECEELDSEAGAKKHLAGAVERVAERLGNTPSVCRSCYIHPRVIEAFLDGSLVTTIRGRLDQALSEDLRELQSEEAAVMVLLRDRLAARSAPPGPARRGA